MNRNDVLEYLRSKKEYFYSTYRIVQIGLFGSYARGTATPQSDIDLLIEFEENTPEIFDKKFEFREEVAKELNLNVDVCRVKSIKSAFRQDILSEAIFA
ncbi:MAG: hypothetical protein HBSAPP04_04400 [Ignavibacteriaceae bacterium]|nr:MAG: hypothetical protein EDM75_00815 [Chlorobiota bacterium]GJQ31601.1 MAG: hypothetical protein HBSAPP04_04400 [Ignavibacteriaceae bacterium]